MFPCDALSDGFRRDASGLQQNYFLAIREGLFHQRWRYSRCLAGSRRGLDNRDGMIANILAYRRQVIVNRQPFKHSRTWPHSCATRS